MTRESILAVTICEIVYLSVLYELCIYSERMVRESIPTVTIVRDRLPERPPRERADPRVRAVRVARVATAICVA
jgi:hypothetical protein